MDGSPPVCEAPAAAIEPQEEKKEEMSTPTPFYKKRISLLLLSCSLLQSLVVLVQELLCLVETVDGGGGTPAPDTPAPTNSPTEKPLDPLREEVARLYIADKITSTADLEDPSSPQNAAWKWLVGKDELSWLVVDDQVSFDKKA